MRSWNNPSARPQWNREVANWSNWFDASLLPSSYHTGKLPPPSDAHYVLSSRLYLDACSLDFPIEFNSTQSQDPPYTLSNAQLHTNSKFKTSAINQSALDKFCTLVMEKNFVFRIFFNAEKSFFHLSKNIREVWRC